jgi:hypothetical protein
MLFEVNSTIFQNYNSIGVRLEDLKKFPKKTIPALCKWMNIKEDPSLYEGTAQGKKWWGDPSSPEFGKEGQPTFDPSSINRKVGSIFSDDDQLILKTLFYPFNVRFGYAEENQAFFKENLKRIRPMIDQMFDFEKKIAREQQIEVSDFMKMGHFLYLRSGLIDRWNTLNELSTYLNMLERLEI